MTEAEFKREELFKKIFLKSTSIWIEVSNKGLLMFIVDLMVFTQIDSVFNDDDFKKCFDRYYCSLSNKPPLSKKSMYRLFKELVDKGVLVKGKKKEYFISKEYTQFYDESRNIERELQEC